MSAESPLEKALNRLLWKMPKPPGCETAEDVAEWIIAEVEQVEGVGNLEWSGQKQEIVKGRPRPGQRGFAGKPKWPPVLATGEKLVSTVDRRTGEYRWFVTKDGIVTRKVTPPTSA